MAVEKTRTLSTPQRNKAHICSMSYMNRELSWLSFNERVLQEAMDENVPLIERMRFLGIYSNNLDEFYRVRVANIKRMISLQNRTIDGYKGTPKELYNEIRSVVLKQQRNFELAYQSIIKKLAEDNIVHLDENTANPEQKAELKAYFRETILHNLVPIILDKKIGQLRLSDKAIYLAVRMEWDKRSKTRFAIIEIPDKLSRFYNLKNGAKKGIILIDDIIRLNLDEIFQIFTFDAVEAYTFKFTRDAELNLDDDVSLSFIEKVEKSIKLRKKGDPVRIVYDYKMPEDLLEGLLDHLNISATGLNTIPGGKYHNFKDFMRFPDFGNPAYLFPEYVPADHFLLQGQRSILKQILASDLLLHFPYQRFDYVVDLLREAAIDSKVKSIKINVYRVAKNSQVMNALINAIRNGKQVTVVLELQARFDEENNLYWAEKLRDNGAHVVYGNETIKIHSKLIQIHRVSDKKDQYISYIGTGNFNERSAKIYTDLGLLTAHKQINEEVSLTFKMMENSLLKPTFKTLMVSPINARKKLLQLIQVETQNAKKGLPAKIQLKVNNLVDKKLIDKLYLASQAGVKIHLIIRGVCCLIPGIAGKSDNINAISVVGRFLEHSRFMIFHNNNKPLYYLSSADWMERNLDKRIEVGTPIYDERIKAQLQDIFELQWKDNVKARKIDRYNKNKYKAAGTFEYHSQKTLMERYHKLKLT